MKEPEKIADKLHVLLTFDDRTHIITREQAQMITVAKNSGQVATASIGNDVVVLNQIAGIPTLSTYRRQMKTKLAEKYQRMCKRCGSILPIADRCACIENDTLPVLAQASKENPVLKTYLVQSGYEDLVLPPPKVEPLPELPPSPKEKEQMKVIQQHKNRLLGKVSMPSSNNDFTKDELSGTMISSHS